MTQPQTDPYANGVCPFGEDEAPGSGCIKPKGHDGAHLVTPGDVDDDEALCPSEFPGDDMHTGQLCTRPRGHHGTHSCTEGISGTSYTREITWA
ncbi:hypothetical protein [Streptomyces rubiginosohelvolus]|uniref:hypothetical protein n=1 Tax=Streptomyces rubiginosohelvolus TaxID=67362 RepID=UPI003408FD83